MPNGCVPGTVSTAECGKCGTQTTICQANCTLATGSCTEPPTSVCAPGQVEFIQGVSCGTGQGRFHYCQPRDAGATACQYGNWSSCTEGLPPTDMIVIPSGFDFSDAGTVSGSPAHFAGDYRLSDPSNKIKRVNTGDCPQTLSSTLTRYSYVGVRNDTARTVFVSLWGSRALVDGGSTSADTVMGAYLRPSVPPTDQARQSCTGFVNDYCYDPPCVSNGYAGLTTNTSSAAGTWALDASPANNANGVLSIPPGETLIVYTTMWSGSADTPLFYRLNVRVENMQ